MLSGCFHIMKLTTRTRMAAIIHTAFIRMLGSRAVKIQLPTMRKPVNKQKSLLILFLGTGEKNQNHKQAKQNLKARQTKQQHVKKLTVRDM